MAPAAAEDPNCCCWGRCHRRRQSLSESQAWAAGERAPFVGAPWVWSMPIWVRGGFSEPRPAREADLSAVPLSAPDSIAAQALSALRKRTQHSDRSDDADGR